MQYPLRILNTDEHIPFEVLLQHDQHKGFYDLSDGRVYITSIDGSIYWHNDVDMTEPEVEIEMNHDTGTMPVWRGWYALPNRDIIFVTHEGEFYLHTLMSIGAARYRNPAAVLIQNALRESKEPMIAEDE